MRRQKYIDKTHISIAHKRVDTYTSHFIYSVMGQYAVISFENSTRIVTAIFIYNFYMCIYISISVYAHLIITGKICNINFCIFTLVFRN